MKKIFITRKLHPIAVETLSRDFEVYMYPKNSPLPIDSLIDAVSNYDAILSTVTENFSKEILDQSSNLKVISNYAAGLDNIDVEYADKLGITVYNIPDSVVNSTADLTFAILLCLIRNVKQASDFVKKDSWKSWDPEIFLGEELNGKVFGILGMGRIGEAVARRAIGFGLNIIYHNRREKTQLTYLGKKIEYVSLEQLLSDSDYISIHIPLNNETYGLIDKDFIERTKNKPILINMSRGEVVKTEDLVASLKKGKLRGAALDVVDPEPMPANNPILYLENCLVVPHIGTATKECRREMAFQAASKIKNFFKNE
jgi:glyoxylate reductase